MSSFQQGSESEIAALEAKLAAARGQSITPEQKKAVAAYDQSIVDAHLAAVPRTKYAVMIGRQIKQLDDISRTYDFPSPPGSDINLVDVIRWFHDFLTTWGPKVKKNLLADDRALETRLQTEQLELRKIQAQIDKLEADALKRKASSIPIDDVKVLFAYTAGELRKFGERLGKRFGAEAQVALNEAIARIDRSVQGDL